MKCRFLIGDIIQGKPNPYGDIGEYEILGINEDSETVAIKGIKKFRKNRYNISFNAAHKEFVLVGVVTKSILGKRYNMN